MAAPGQPKGSAQKRWVYVGTPGRDGVEAHLTPESPAFMNDWTNRRIGLEDFATGPVFIVPPAD